MSRYLKPKFGAYLPYTSLNRRWPCLTGCRSTHGWKALPQHVIFATLFHVFRNQLKINLFRRCYIQRSLSMQCLCSDSEWVSRVQRPHQHIIGHFGHQSFLHVSAGLCQPQPPMPTISCTRRPRRPSRKNSLLRPSYSFAVAGPATWNSLPASLRNDQLSVPAFRRLLKTELFARAYDSTL